MRFSIARAVLWVVCLIGGVIYGAAGTVAHAYRLGPVPVGLIVALIGLSALLVGLRLLTGDRWCALVAGAAAFVTTVLLSGQGPGGSVIVPSGALDELGGVSLGMVWAIGLALATTLVVAWPDLSALRRTPLD